ncbi:MAG: formyl transferase [Hyphomicrobiaceae bacterium]
MALVHETDRTLAGPAAVAALAGASAVLPDNEPTERALRDGEPAGDGDIVMLVGDAEIPAMMVHALAEKFGPVTVIQEEKQPSSVMIKRRAKMLGPIQAFGQVGFGVLLKFLHKRADARKAEIVAEGGLSTERPASVTHHRVASVNDAACRTLILAADPKVIVLVGTRMVRAETLYCAKAPVINYHAGLNPTYRGMNGGYWALAYGDVAGAGVTVHLVDEGVDTGKELYWTRFTPTPRDNFVTYPLLQAIAGRDLLIGAVRDALDGELKPQDVRLRSAQWFHPTIWGYLWRGVVKGVW